ncbi:MAG: ShlB/FhaC/HecB family hemolysin secretion/activation protein [Phycisphaerales bacterium]|nr:ShlB/FhaC/HecB family hemolysin secretion/activation protein [Phycisphaerales bacterium]
MSPKGHVRLARLLLIACVLVGLAPWSQADSITVQSIQFLWDEQHELLPEGDSLQTVPFMVRRTSAGLAPAMDGETAIHTDIAAMNRMGGARCTKAVIHALAKTLAEHLQKDGLVGATVLPKQIPVQGLANEFDIFLVGHLPLDGGKPNPAIPANLQPLGVSATPPDASQNSYWTIQSVDARWRIPNPLLIEAASVRSVEVRLGERDGRYTSPENGRRILVDSIRNFIAGGNKEFDESALETIAQAVSNHLKMQGFEQATATAVVSGNDRLLLELSIEADTSPAPEEGGQTAQQDTPATEDLTSKPASDDGKPSAAQTPSQELPATKTETSTADSTPPATSDDTADVSTETDSLIINEPDPSVDGLPYMVDTFSVAYLYDHPHLPPTANFMDLPLVLGYIDTEEGDRNWVGPRAGVNITQTTLNKINEAGGGVFWSSCIATISSTISRVLIEDDLLGVFVIPNPKQISSAPGDLGKDLRPEGDTELTILITVGRVVESRTIAQGDRIPDDQTFNNETHTSIKQASPAKPHDETADADTADEERSDLIRKSDLTDYVHHLNRHPGRNVEASVAASAVPGGVSLDYLVFEADPLTLYYEIGNTGTPQERSLRQRFGLVHSQLTGNDDILALEYVTSNFSRTNAVLGSYQFRLSDDNRIRGSVIGSWNKFVNDQFGQDFVQYTGYSWSAGGQMTFNIFQDGPFFIDIVPGMNYQKVKVNNELLEDSGMAGFALPNTEILLSRQDNKGLFQAMVGLEGSFISQNVNELTLLGRIDPSEQWARLNWSASLSTFLEPLLNPAGWGDPDSPGSSTLAHELALRFTGQYSFDYRLVPQFQSTMGGLYSVRGYAQSVVAGDNSVFGSIEYRFHLPRTFAVNPEPLEFMGGPFRMAPQHVYGRPDWDLIFKGFFDAGYVFQNGNEGFEVNNTLLGAGIGLEFLYKSNLRVQLDWGFALHDLKFGLAEAGSSRLYVTGTFLW